MSHRSTQALWLTAVSAILFSIALLPGEAAAFERPCDDGCIVPHVQAPPDLFYNFYVQTPPGGTGAQLYLSPVPTPPRVGHTWITYQPLMPHEMMYCHGRRYYRYNISGGSTKTTVRWW